MGIVSDIKLIRTDKSRLFQLMFPGETGLPGVHTIRFGLWPRALRIKKGRGTKDPPRQWAIKN